MTQLDPISAPPVVKVSPGVWVRRNLFSSWYNTLLTIVCGWLIYVAGRSLLGWAVFTANWEVVSVNLPLFLVGRYPPSLYGRLWGVLGIAIAFFAFVGYKITHPRQRHKVLDFAVYLLPVAFLVILWLIGGGFGLRTVPTSLWNGLLLTILMAVVSIVLSFPLGVLLALGRQSELPVIRWLCIAYIEIVRGLPLIGILFIAQNMLPLFLPLEVRLDRVVRGVAGLTLFSAAYLAENVRGGLQAVPRGQVEASRALGLNAVQLLLLVVLPQAFRVAIPAIAGQFIGLFKDTSLLSLVAVVELTGMARSILAQPQFIGRYAEVYLFVGAIYWIFCYSLSWLSRRLEQQLDQGKR